MLHRLRYALAARLHMTPNEAMLDTAREALEWEAIAEDEAIPRTELAANYIQNLRV